MLLRAIICVVLLGGLNACKAPEPDNLFRTGRDTREFNPATGRYEWPDRRG